MALSRRQFIKRTGLITAGSLFGPSLFRNPWLRQAVADSIGDRFFVVFYLNGGNDGLNTVTPIGNGPSGNGPSAALRDAYEAARGTGPGGLRLPASGSGGLLQPALPFLDPHTGAQLGFHPGLSGINDLYNMGKVAVIQGCGYPLTDFRLSHEASRGAWQTANPLGVSTVTNGWMGRYLAANYGGTDIPGVTIGSEVAGEYVQYATSVLAMGDVADFNFPYDTWYPSDASAKEAAFRALCASANANNVQPTFSYLTNSGTATVDAASNYPTLDDLYTSARQSFDDQYTALDTGSANDLREIAKIIYGVTQNPPKVSARFFELDNGGYDTHSDQGTGNPTDQQYSLHKELGDAINLFYQDCADMGVANKVCIIVWSEFGRRIQQNTSGTDHGSQAPVFVIGGAVQGGVYGNHPDIRASSWDDDGCTVYSQDPANPFKSTDLRDIYGTLLKHWMGVSDPSVYLPAEDPNNFDPALYWTAPNFDLGFI